jgi:hypothetical protein
MAPKPWSREVATLCHFFLNLGGLESALTAALKPVRLKVQVKGAFGHYSKPFGPVVGFGDDSSLPGCELCDMMFIVTYAGPKGSEPFGNASFFQAKLNRGKLLSGKSSKRQGELYESADSFIFRDSKRYASAFPENKIPGWREMPGKATTGFCFWSFDAREGVAEGWPWIWQASAVIKPTAFKNPSADRTFAEAVFELMTGEFGLAVEKPAPGDFGWNRIVHDFVFRAARESLGYSHGVSYPSDIRRIQQQNPSDISWLLNSGVSIVANPFQEFFDWFGSGELSDLPKKDHLENRYLGPEALADLRRKFRFDGALGEPPLEPPADDEEPGPDDAGGGGSFVHINVSPEEGRF